MHESRAVLNALLNHSTSRVPINKLPTEVLGRIFAIIAGSTPCYLENSGRDTLLDIPRVCARWYQVATSTRSLCSHIDIYNPPHDADTNLVRLRLERSHGVPLHIHLGSDYPAMGNMISKIVPILQPYKASTSSLLISGMDSSDARALFALYFGDSGPEALSALTVCNVRDSGVSLPWPTYPTPGLTSLELHELGSASPALDDLANLLSGSPCLHTLRLSQLRNFRAHLGDQQDYRTISLPHLKLFEFAAPGTSIFAPLLTMIHPGKLELHVRLGIPIIGEGLVPRAARLLLTRSNVVSLALSRINSRFAPDIRSFFLCVPSLRALRVNCLEHNVEPFLAPLADDNTLQSLPSLELLCLSNGEINSRLMNQIKSMVEAGRLHSLIFWSCRFPAAFVSEAEYQQDYIDLVGMPDINEDEDEGQDLDLGLDEEEDEDVDIGILGALHELGTPDKNFPFMPKATKEWLLEYVERLVVCETPLDRTINGVDVLAQEMTKIDSNDYV
ncbi:hypothetical protein FRC12_021784 [Ceratobasidium sp. 428]|nr:hypothetical protein FRC12_021784 [Ceratobasidium sp. 428]